jgi:hypothetical protein
MRRIEIFLCAPIFAFAASANAGALDEAKQVLDQASGPQCELLMMQYQSHALAPESQERKALSAKLYLRAAELERDLAPDMRRFEAAKAALTKDELDELQRHSRALLEACSKQAYETYHVRIPTPVSSDAPRPKAVPYTPAMVEKSTQRAETPGATEKRQPVQP